MNSGMSSVKARVLAAFRHLDKKDDVTGLTVSLRLSPPMRTAHFFSGKKFSITQTWGCSGFAPMEEKAMCWPSGWTLK